MEPRPRVRSFGSLLPFQLHLVFRDGDLCRYVNGVSLLLPRQSIHRKVLPRDHAAYDVSRRGFPLRASGLRGRKGQFSWVTRLRVSSFHSLLPVG